MLVPLSFALVGALSVASGWLTLQMRSMDASMRNTSEHIERERQMHERQTRVLLQANALLSMRVDELEEALHFQQFPAPIGSEEYVN